MKLAVVSVDQIEVGERFRKDYGNLVELSTSIKKDELINPIAVWQKPDSRERPDGNYDGQPYLLLAGGRRFAAIVEAKIETIPVRIFDKPMTELEMRVIELSENIYRKDLEWHEKANLCRQIHDLQMAIHGASVKGTRSDLGQEKKGWSQGDTADMLGRSKMAVSQDIALAKVLETMPELKDKCKTADEARKFVGKIYEGVLKEEIATRVMSEQQKTPLDVIRSTLVGNYIIKDCLAGIAELPDGQFDIVEIDPPYAIDLTKQKRSADDMHLQTTGYEEIVTADYLPFMDKLISLCYRKMSTDSWLLLWFGPDPWFGPLFDILMKRNFEGKAMPFIWTKGSGQCMQPTLYMANSYEMCFYVRKGNPVLQKQGRANIFDYKPIPATSKTHPTERPIELMQDILDVFSQPGQRLLVPFAGSGNTILAGSNRGMQGLGFDLNRTYKDSYTVKVFDSRPGAYVSYK